jgi:hypothetical protein
LLEVRTPDGNLYRRVTEEHGRSLVANRWATEVRSPSGKLRYLSLRLVAAPSFTSTIAADSITTHGRRERREHHRGRCEAYKGVR